MKFTKKTDSNYGPGGEKFLKVKSGESVKGVFMGEIYEYHIRWENGKSVIVGPDEPGARSRYELNFVMPTEGKLVAKVFGFSQTVYNLLAEIHKEYDLSKTKVKLSRSGEGLETEWSILPLVSDKDKLTPELLAKIEAIPLNILDNKKTVKLAPKSGPEDFDGPPMPSFEDPPF